jgi:DUF438 domain-containing protein
METGNRIEVEKSGPNGRTWLIQAAPVRDHKGGIIGGVEIALDITKYKQRGGTRARATARAL